MSDYAGSYANDRQLCESCGGRARGPMAWCESCLDGEEHEPVGLSIVQQTQARPEMRTVQHPAAERSLERELVP
jgi:hypothetical protein